MACFQLTSKRSKMLQRAKPDAKVTGLYRSTRDKRGWDRQKVLPQREVLALEIKSKTQKPEEMNFKLSGSCSSGMSLSF